MRPLLIEDGPLGACYQFDGDNDSVRVPFSDTLDVTSGALTVSAWVQTDLTANRAAAYPVAHGSMAIPGYGLIAGNGDWYLRLFDDNMVGNNTDFGTNQELNGPWRHIAAAFEIGTTTSVHVYLDGEHILSEPDVQIGPITNPGVDLYFSHVPNLFKGKLDEARISRDLKSEEWLHAVHGTAMEPDSYYAIGDEEVAPQ